MNKNNSNDVVYFYSEKMLSDGKVHRSICSFSNVSRTVTYPSDFMDVIKH